MFLSEWVLSVSLSPFRVWSVGFLLFGWFAFVCFFGRVRVFLYMCSGFSLVVLSFFLCMCWGFSLVVLEFSLDLTQVGEEINMAKLLKTIAGEKFIVASFLGIDILKIYKWKVH